MSKLKKFCLSLVSLLSALCLTAGIGLYFVVADDDPDVGYNDKLIARYTLDEITEETVDEVTTKYFNAIDGSGNALPDMKAVTTASVAVNAMEGRGAGNFSAHSIDNPINMVIPAFLESEATGFSISGWMINQAGDWNTLFRYGTLWAEGTSEFALPNLTYRLNAAFCNFYPLDANKVNGGQWDSFINNNTPITSNNINEYMYITVSVDAADGITYYKDGVELIHYPIDTVLNNGAGATGTHTVNEIVVNAIQAAKTTGIIFGEGITRFDDLKISNVLSDEEVAEQYNNSVSLNISKIYKDGVIYKEFNYMEVSAGVPFESPEFIFYYLKDADDPEGDPNNNLEPEITFEASTLSSVNGEGVYGSITPIDPSEYTITFTKTEPVIIGEIEIYYKT